MINLSQKMCHRVMPAADKKLSQIKPFLQQSEMQKVQYKHGYFNICFNVYFKLTSLIIFM